MIPPSTWLFVIFCGLFLCSASAAPKPQRPKKQEEPEAGVAPPQPVPLTVKVQRGGKTEIPLRIFGKANEPLTFLVRTPPAQGKASDPRSTGRETAVTVYEPPADVSVVTDRFLYSVKSAAGVSAPVEISVIIVDQPPQLGIPDSLEFAPQGPGAVSSQMLEITNRGGGLAIGEVIVEAPWKIDGKTAYKLGAGDVAVFKIVFAPGVGGTYESVARFTSDPTHSTTLRGTAESAVTANPTEVVLQNVGNDPVRTGTLELINQTDDERSLEFKADARLQIPPRVTLAAKGRISVPIQTAPDDVRALKSEIRVVAPDLDLRVPVSAALLGPILKISPQSVAFGRVPADRPTVARFELENAGGAAGEATWKVELPFRTNQTSVLLLPGEKRAIDLQIESKAPGKFRGWLQGTVGGHSFEIPIEAEVVAGVVAQQPPSPSMPRPGTGNVIPSTTSTDGESPVAPEPIVQPNLPPAVPKDWLGEKTIPPGVSVSEIASTRATIEWPASLSTASRFRVEMRQFSYNADRSLNVAWLELGGIEAKKLGPNWTVTVRDLQPGQPWTFRVLPLKADGSPDSPLFTIGFKTPPKPSLIPHVSPLRGLFTVLIGLLLWRAFTWWKQRR